MEFELDDISPSALTVPGIRCVGGGAGKTRDEVDRGSWDTRYLYIGEILNLSSSNQRATGYDLPVLCE